MQWRVTSKILSQFSLTDVQVTLKQILILVLIQAFYVMSRPFDVFTLYGVMGRRIDPSWGEPIELFLVPASAPRLV